MPPRKKAKKSAPKEPEDPLEYANHIREEAGKRFNKSIKKKNVNLDIEQNIREIRALLKINDEIFERCMSAEWTHVKYKKTLVTFTRYGFDVVKVRPSGTGTSTQFITEPQCSKKEFDMTSLSDLPTGIDNLFVVKYQAEPFTMFVDFKAFFECAIMLNDEILEPFLAKLKCHIESIHVCLGEVESWLLEPKSNIKFINDTFGRKIESNSAYKSTDRCISCEEKLGAHNRYYHSTTDSTFYCPYGGGVFKKYIVLKTCDESGKFEKTFAIAEKGEQKKLKKFIDFMSS